MTTTRDTAIAFRWRSVLGLSVGLFLAWGLINAAFAIYVPYTLHTGGVTSVPLVLTGFAVAYTTVVWFGLRTGHIWALWVAAVAGLVAFVYFLPILDLYAQYSIPAGNFLAFIAVAVVAVSVATALGWFGLRAAAVGVWR